MAFRTLTVEEFADALAARTPAYVQCPPRRGVRVALVLALASAVVLMAAAPAAAAEAEGERPISCHRSR